MRDWSQSVEANCSSVERRWVPLCVVEDDRRCVAVAGRREVVGSRQDAEVAVVVDDLRQQDLGASESRIR